jgi:hypothetical protein
MSSATSAGRSITEMYLPSTGSNRPLGADSAAAACGSSGYIGSSSPATTKTGAVNRESRSLSGWLRSRTERTAADCARGGAAFRIS